MNLKNWIEGEVYFVTDTVVDWAGGKGVAGSGNCISGIT